MRKATIIVIAAIYIASIVIVGLFGLQALPYDEFVYIDDFIFEEIGGVTVRDIGDGSGTKYVMLTYVKDLIVLIDYTPKPANATMRNDVDVEIVYQSSGDEENPIARLEYDAGYVLHFYKEGTVTVAVKSKDDRKVTRELMIVVTAPRG